MLAHSLTCGVARHLNSVPVHLAVVSVAATANESKEAVTILVAVGKAQRYSSQAVAGALDARAYHCYS